MKRSEIFENFVKIAQDKGLVAKAESTEPEHTEKKTKNPRWDSLTIEQISKLYNVKSDMPKDMEYDRNIIEDAHPDPVVVSPSYDKLNGLVENENEGQNIRARIVMKDPDGQLVNRKYAENQLVLSLVRLANDLDNRNQDELRKLADYCLLQTTASKKKIVKTALVPLIVGGVAAILGSIYLKNHVRFHSDGFAVDFQKAMNEMDDILTSNSNFGVGVDYRPEFIQVVTDLKDKLQKFYVSYQGLVPALDKLDAPKTGPELLQLSQQPETKGITDQVTKFRTEAMNIYPFIRKIMQNFSNEAYKSRQVANKGVITQVFDAVPGLHGGSNLIADDIDDVKRALETVLVDITNIMKNLQNSVSVEQSAKQELQQSNDEFQKNVVEQPNPAAPVNTSAPTGGNDKEEAPWSDLEKQMTGIPGLE